MRITTDSSAVKPRSEGSAFKRQTINEFLKIFIEIFDVNRKK